MKVLAIVGTELRRFARDRSNIFFVLVFPLAIVLLIGLQFSQSPNPALGVVAGAGPVSDEVIAMLEADAALTVIRHDDPESALRSLDDGDLAAAVVFPADLDERVAAGETTEIGFIASSAGAGPQLRAVVDDATARALAGPTALAAAIERGADPVAANNAVGDLAHLVEVISVGTVTTGDRLFPEDLDGFDIGAPGQLVLFMFLTALAGSATMIQSRNLGVSSRMLSTPTSPTTIIAGEAASRFTIAVTQGLYIMGATVVLFGMNWGNLIAAAAILIAFGAVGAAAAMLAGATFKNDQQAGGVSVVVALGLAAMGGSMLPVELFSDTMLTVARAIPHYWALDAFTEIVRHDGTIGDITTNLAALMGFAIAIGSIAVWRFRLTLTSG